MCFSHLTIVFLLVTGKVYAQFTTINNSSNLCWAYVGGKCSSLVCSCYARKNDLITLQLHHCIIKKGALVAALGDLSFNLIGYIVIFFNDLFTALNGVLLKRTSDEYKKSKMTVLYLNSLLSAIGVAIVITLVPGEVDRVKNFELWSNSNFVTYLVFASLLGSVLNLAIFLCTSTNSALTTTVVGCLKNVLTSYLGMFIGGDYIFSWLSFLGINISIAGSLVYARATFRR